VFIEFLVQKQIQNELFCYYQWFYNRIHVIGFFILAGLDSSAEQLLGLIRFHNIFPSFFTDIKKCKCNGF